jgi:hypothetical protein
VTEIEFEQAVVDLAHMFDWRVASFRPAQTGKGWRTPVKYDGKGLPDLTMVHASGHVIFAEMKAQRGTLSPEQAEWGAVMLNATANITMLLRDEVDDPPVAYCVWRPDDADDIARILSFGRVTKWAL